MGWRRKGSGSDGTIDPANSNSSSDSNGSGDSSGAEMSGIDQPDVLILDELSRVFADEPETHVPGSTVLGPEVSGTGVSAAPHQNTPDVIDARPTIAIGGGGDLPDAVYLDDESGDAGSPVFIDDDGSSDAVMPKDATSHGIEPKLRQRRIGVRRAASRRRLWWFALAVVVILAVGGVLAVLGSSLFAVDTVSVSGNVYTNAEQLDAVVEELRGTPVLLVDTDAVEEQLEKIAWVESARVTTQFPDAARVELRERTPVASMLGEDARSRVLDSDGRVLDVIEGQPVALVWISGPGTLDLAAGDSAPIGYASAASLVTKLTPAIRTRVESMLVTPDGSDLVLVLTSPSGPIEVRFGSAIGDNAQIEKLVRLERKLADIGDDPVSVIDVSTAEVTVR